MHGGAFERCEVEGWSGAGDAFGGGLALDTGARAELRACALRGAAGAGRTASAPSGPVATSAVLVPARPCLASI